MRRDPSFAKTSNADCVYFHVCYVLVIVVSLSCLIGNCVVVVVVVLVVVVVIVLFLNVYTNHYETIYVAMPVTTTEQTITEQ